MSVFSHSEIDDLGQRLRAGVTVSDLRRLDEYRRTFRGGYDVVRGKIREHLGCEVSGRPAKSTAAILEKLVRSTMRLSQMQDIAGCRIVLGVLAQQDAAVATLRTLFRCSVVDRRVVPSYGYRAVHVIARADGKPIEIQVRTLLQHLWAELSEKLADVHDRSIKHGGGKKDVREALESISDLIRRVEKLEGNLEVSEEVAGIREDLAAALKKTASKAEFGVQAWAIR